MGLTKKSMGFNLKESEVYKDNESDIIIALMGNPNVGKSTIFNALTGLNQHTGNWTGKTVAKAIGKFNYNDEDFQQYKKSKIVPKKRTIIDKAKNAVHQFFN